VDDAADAVVSADSAGVEVADGSWYRLEGCRLLEGSVRAVLVVMSLVVAVDSQQMSLVPDQRLVERFAAAATDPAFHDLHASGAAATGHIDTMPTHGHLTQPGDVIFLPNRRISALVDHAGGHLLAAPLIAIRSNTSTASGPSSRMNDGAPQRAAGSGAGQVLQKCGPRSPDRRQWSLSNHLP
jgi:hypothetical protein